MDTAQKSLEGLKKHNRFKELDALRGIAAIMVVLFHFTMDRPERNLGFKFGVTGVDLFFIISGFVIYMSLTKVKSSLEFVINRISRLYPTYWVCVTVTFILICIKVYLFKSLVLHPPSLWDYLANMTMFQYYLGANDLDGPYWTMIIEMIFYIGVLILFKFHLLKYINILGITISLGVAGLTVFFHDHAFAHQIFKAIPLLSFVPLFFAGIIFYNIYEYKDKLIARYAMLLMCLFCQISLYHYGGTSWWYLSQAEYAVMLTIYFLLFVLFVNGKLKFVVNKITLFLGKLSFPLYLVHQFVAIRFVIPALTNKMNLNYWAAAFLVALPVVLILAYFINRYVEIPVSKQMRKKLNSISGVNAIHKAANTSM